MQKKYISKCLHILTFTTAMTLKLFMHKAVPQLNIGIQKKPLHH